MTKAKDTRKEATIKATNTHLLIHTPPHTHTDKTDSKTFITLVI